MPGALLSTAFPLGGQNGAGRSRRAKAKGVTAKKMKRVLKAHGLKTTGRKATLTMRVKKNGLMKKVTGGEA